MAAWKTIGTVLLFSLVALCLAPTLIPPFLDRVYYRGPTSDHFDGARFRNPGEAADGHGGPSRFLNRWMAGDRAIWPERVEVRQAVPLARVAGTAMRVTWVGHATILIQTNGLNILTDPVWADRASPFGFVGPRRVRAPGIALDRLPPIDLVLVSHNHYDHMDVATLRRLARRDRPLIVTSLGNDTILKRNGIAALAGDWGQEIPIRRAGCADCPASGSVLIERSHHWSSRWGTDRNRALWSAFTLRLPGGNIFFAGDTGWGDGSWARDASAHGPFRLALIPIGAYAPRDFMQTNHIDTAEAMKVFDALRPLRAIGIHWGTFQLTFEPIDEPRQRLEALARTRGLAPDRFMAVEAGRGIDVPALPMSGGTGSSGTVG